MKGSGGEPTLTLLSVKEGDCFFHLMSALPWDQCLLGEKPLGKQGLLEDSITRRFTG